MTNHQSRKGLSGGFSLIEVVVALAILSTGVIIIVGLFASGLQSGRQATDQTMAAMIAQDLANEIRLKTSACNNYPNATPTYNLGFLVTPLPAGTNPPSGTNGVYQSPQYYDASGLVTSIFTIAPTSTIIQQSYYRADIVFTPLSVGGGVNNLERVVVQVSWPVVDSIGNVPCTDGTLGNPTTKVAKNKFVYSTEIAKPDY